MNTMTKFQVNRIDRSRVKHIYVTKSQYCPYMVKNENVGDTTRQIQQNKNNCIWTNPIIKVHN